jgi:hypothetical protein
MHEIPNFPYPSLQEPEQPAAQQANSNPSEPKEATERRDSDD